MVEKDPKVVDMVFKQKLEQQQALRKRRKKKRRKKFLTVLIVMSLFSLYFLTELSKPQAINVRGNQVLSKDEVLKTADLSLDSYLVLANPIVLKYRLKKHPIITDVSINHSIFKRVINLDVKEIDLFGYRQNESGSTLILFDGSSIELTPDLYPFLEDLIYINGFEEEEDQKRLVESFRTLDETVKNQISELHQTSVSYDDKLIEIRMNKGNKVYTSFQSVERLNYYFDILPALASDESCLYIDEMSGEVYAKDCED